MRQECDVVGLNVVESRVMAGKAPADWWAMPKIQAFVVRREAIPTACISTRIEIVPPKPNISSARQGQSRSVQ
jgi:hypothetical protein